EQRWTGDSPTNAPRTRTQPRQELHHPGLGAPLRGTLDVEVWSEVGRLDSMRVQHPERDDPHLCLRAEDDVALEHRHESVEESVEGTDIAVVLRLGLRGSAGFVSLLWCHAILAAEGTGTAAARVARGRVKVEGCWVARLDYLRDEDRGAVFACANGSRAST